jgi:hypothetical protein
MVCLANIPSRDIRSAFDREGYSISNFLPPA